MDCAAGQQRMGRNLHAGYHWHRRNMQIFAEVIGRNDRDDSSDCLRRACVDGNYFRVRQRTARECQVEHSGKLDILCIASFAGHEGRVLDAANGRADQSSRGVLGCHLEASRNATLLIVKTKI